MSAVEWETQCVKLRELMRLWSAMGDVKTGSPEIHSPILALRNGEERRKFWRQRPYSEAERTVRLTFEWRDPDTAVANRDWRLIELVGKSAPTPWENLAMLVGALEEVRLAFKRGNMRVMYNVLHQFYPPATTGGPVRIQYRDRIVYQREGAHPADSPYAVLQVDEDAPFEVCQAAYRAQAKRMHPDKGGSHEAQKRLNMAFERICVLHGHLRNQGREGEAS